MSNFFLFLLIFIILVIFLLFQIYFYQNKIAINNTKIKNMEQFENKLEKINYKLDIPTIQNLLSDYNYLNKN
jgi:hypothetical protein